VEFVDMLTLTMKRESRTVTFPPTIGEFTVIILTITVGVCPHKTCVK